MNNTHVYFHLYGLDVYLTYVYISTHRELGTIKDYLRLTRKLKEKYQFLTIFTSNTNLQIKTFKDSSSLEVQDSNLKVNRNANFVTSAFMDSQQTGSKDSTSYRNFSYQLVKSNLTTGGGETHGK